VATDYLKRVFAVTQHFRKLQAPLGSVELDTLEGFLEGFDILLEIIEVELAEVFVELRPPCLEEARLSFGDCS